jgi:eukaryotic-like serine/threonine-protein kinase
VYAIGAESGEVRWVYSTGDWVYASPAVANRTVFVGSYDGTFYALDARTGEPRWTFEADDRIAGSASVIDDASTSRRSAARRTALDIRTGGVLWSTDDGRMAAGIVTDGEWVFLGGDTELHAYVSASVKRPTGAQRAAAKEARSAG